MTLLSVVVLLAVRASTALADFAITSLDATGSSAIEHEPITDDDHGGIAVSRSHVFYTGDSATGRFLLTDLSGGAGVGYEHDGLVSNLRTGDVYTLGNGNTPIVSGGTVTSLLRLDGSTGTFSGTRIDLSSPITAPSGTGIFAGDDRVVLHNTSRVFSIALPSGVVTDLGPTPTPVHTSCETWAYWGVAEDVAGTVFLTYVQGFQTIARMRVPDGLTTTLASFSSLSDMCSFTISLCQERWYFHHEGNSQFRSGDETIGFADASWAGDALNDSDGDGLADACDNCPDDINPGQGDADGDNFGDACDTCTGFGTVDTDGDGVCDESDNCLADANSGQTDTDGDGFGDACDFCPAIGTVDTDEDGICDDHDNCPTVANSGQEDTNADDIGDACSPQVTIGPIMSSGGALDTTAIVTSPVGQPLFGEVDIVPCDQVDALSYTWLATSCNGEDSFELTINGTTVASVQPDPGGLSCSCFPGVSTYSVPLSVVRDALTPGVNRLGVRKSGSNTIVFTALAWAYATITISGNPQRVEIFDADGGNSYDNSDLCGSSYTFESVDAQADAPALPPPLISQAWSGGLPCSVDVSSLSSSACYLLFILADDGLVGSPSSDSEEFNLTSETELHLNGVTCDDGDGCTLDDTCGDGSCNSGAPKNCADNNPCTDDSCSVPSGTCVHTNNTAPCPDGLFCNGDDTCGGGSCSVHSGNPCAAGTQCANICNESADDCLNPAGTSCGDNNPCTDDTCDGAGTCNSLANTEPCTDSLFCNGTDTCGGGSCSVHTGNPCAGGSECADACNETADDCFDVIGTPCTADNNVCTDDQCNGAGLCGHPNNSAPCNDNNACTTSDTCSGGVCQGSGSSGPCPTPVGTVTADVFVDSSHTSTNYGTNTLLSADNDPAKRIYVRVHLTGITGQTITTARLNLRVANVTGAESDSGGRIRKTSCAWNESTLKWNTPPPAPIGSAPASLGGVVRNQAVSFDVKSLVLGGSDGDFCFVIDTASGNGVDYNSLSATSGRPSFTLTTACTCGGGSTTTTSTTSTTTTTHAPTTTSLGPTTTVVTPSTTTTTTPSGVITLERRVSAKEDDAEEDEDGDVELNSSDLELVNDGDNQTVGIRFRNVTVPRNATIVNAYVQFKVDETPSGTASLRVYLQLIGNASAFTTADGNISSRGRTGFVAWNPVVWNTEGVAGSAQRTTNLATPIQTIVNLGTWNSGQALAVIITGTGKRVAEAYDGDAGGAPLLHIEYTP